MKAHVKLQKWQSKCNSFVWEKLLFDSLFTKGLNICSSYSIVWLVNSQSDQSNKSVDSDHKTEDLFMNPIDLVLQFESLT